MHHQPRYDFSTYFQNLLRSGNTWQSSKQTKWPTNKGQQRTQRLRHKGQDRKVKRSRSTQNTQPTNHYPTYLFRPWDPCKQFHAIAVPCRSFPLPPSSPRTSNGIPNDFQSVPSVETLPNTSSTTRTPTVRTCGERESNRGISAY